MDLLIGEMFVSSSVISNILHFIFQIIGVIVVLKQLWKIEVYLLRLIRNRKEWNAKV